MLIYIVWESASAVLEMCVGTSAEVDFWMTRVLLGHAEWVPGCRDWSPSTRNTTIRKVRAWTLKDEDRPARALGARRLMLGERRRSLSLLLCGFQCSQESQQLNFCETRGLPSLLILLFLSHYVNGHRYSIGVNAPHCHGLGRTQGSPQRQVWQPGHRGPHLTSF